MSKSEKNYEASKKAETHYRRTSQENLDPIQEVYQETILQDNMYLGDSTLQKSYERRQRESS